ncbi:hypothetical protein Y032_0712g1742 [Ancylostoma ceylanicum]|uniref:Uncharacterized protein n=1 Tax=Ancylostoma ceylanicum TaxID=53326 RepID=A0A016WHQ0_9BILA|nr:hypothetical protein Y032_0712g1742 [Ancylostoma ceylanicum]
MYTDFNDGKISDLDNFLWEISNGIKKIAGNFTDFVRPLQNRRTLIKTSRELWSETVSPAEHPVAIQQEAATRWCAAAESCAKSLLSEVCRCAAKKRLTRVLPADTPRIFCPLPDSPP